MHIIIILNILSLRMLHAEFHFYIFVGGCPVSLLHLCRWYMHVARADRNNCFCLEFFDRHAGDLITAFSFTGTCKHFADCPYYSRVRKMG
ncbi:hypothetical protein BRADI_1g43955v3 [Brachypodium distachyon]|uniref:Uncharacterized protein n=1 Tax=Brachypodium distachyon TaxID=15368 RepID=A0A2K2DP91_BRADI|nr:hypothetical protein BRADI_1g43955v3 [Brachypodium distachyon]